MLNACLRCSTLFAGIYTLVQALLWAAGSIYLVAIYSCQAPYPLQSQVDNIHDVSPTYLFYLSYLRGKCRDPYLNYEASSAARTYNIMMAYSIISSIWVPTAVLLLVGVCAGTKGKSAKWFYLPWLLLTTACAILDIYSTIVYGIDISDTMTTSSYFQFLEMTPEVEQELGLVDRTRLNGWTITPAIIMTILVSRGIIIWLINFFFLIFGCQGIMAFSKKQQPPVPPPYQKWAEANREVEPEGKGEGQWISFTKANPQQPPANNQQMDPRRQQYPGQMDPRGQQYPGQMDPRGQQHQSQTQVDGRGQPYPMPVTVRNDQRPEETRRRYEQVEGMQKHSDPSSERSLKEDQVEPSRGVSNPAFTSDEPLRLDPVLVAVERTTKEVRYAEVESIEMEAPPEEHHEQFDDVIVLGSTDTVEDAASALSEEEAELAAADEQQEDEPPAKRNVFGPDGTPTDEPLTPRIYRVRRILEQQMNATPTQSKSDVSGYNMAKPFSYTQPMKPQVDNLEDMKPVGTSDLEKPPIPVPDYSVRVAKTPNRSPLQIAEE